MNSPQLLIAYLNAVYSPAGPDAWRVRVGRRATELERDHAWASRFALISAWNPDSRRQPDTRNLNAQQALERELADACLRFLSATSASPDGSWREASHLVFDAPLAALDGLACRHGQAAVLAWERGRAVRLRSYRGHWRASAESAHVDTRFVDWVACAPT